MKNALRPALFRFTAILFAGALCVILAAGCSDKDDGHFEIGALAVTEFGMPIYEGFFDGMADLGYIEGENVEYDIRVSRVDVEEYRDIVTSFVEAGVDLIFVSTTEASVVAKEVVRDSGIPVVFTFAFTEESGLIDSIRLPGGNITGIRYPGPDIGIKRLEVMAALMPEASNIFVPFEPDYPTSAIQFDPMKDAADRMGLNLFKAPAANHVELERFLMAEIESGDRSPDAIITISGPLGVDSDVIALLNRLSADYGIPYGGTYVTGGEEGPIFGVASDHYKAGEQAAPLADKILKGTPAGTIPVVSSEYYTQVDIRRATAIGIEIPELLLLEADQIVR